MLVCEKYEVTNGCTTVITFTAKPNRSVCHLSRVSPWNYNFCYDSAIIKISHVASTISSTRRMYINMYINQFHEITMTSIPHNF